MILVEYMRYLQRKRKSPQTVISYMNDLHQFFDAAGIHAEDDVTEADIRKWVAQMMRPSEGAPLAVSTINRRLNALRSFYTWAKRNKKIQHNPMEGIENLKSADEKTNADK